MHFRVCWLQATKWTELAQRLRVPTPNPASTETWGYHLLPNYVAVSKLLMSALSLVSSIAKEDGTGSELTVLMTALLTIDI